MAFFRLFTVSSSGRWFARLYCRSRVRDMSGVNELKQPGSLSFSALEQVDRKRRAFEGRVMLC